MSQHVIEFSINENLNVELSVPNGVFKPTATTNFLVDSVAEYIEKPGTLLDLGSGSGVVGISLFKKNLVQSPLYASDYSEPAIESITENCGKYDVPVVAKYGSLFEPWKGKKFDFIVDDISGVAEEIATISPWFENIPCDSGKDGTSLTLRVLEQAPHFLNSNGILFFPVISFSNTDKIIEFARLHFTHVELIRQEEWPLPREMEKHLPIIKRAHKNGHIKLKELFGMTICFTEIYAAYD